MAAVVFREKGRDAPLEVWFHGIHPRAGTMMLANAIGDAVYDHLGECAGEIAKLERAVKRRLR